MRLLEDVQRCCEVLEPGAARGRRVADEVGSEVPMADQPHTRRRHGRLGYQRRPGRRRHWPLVPAAHARANHRARRPVARERPRLRLARCRGADRRAAGRRTRSRAARSGPVYIAILPAIAAEKRRAATRPRSSGSSTTTLGRDGTYAVVVGNHFRALSNTLAQGEAGKLATEALNAHSSDGVTAMLVDFVDRVGVGARTATATAAATARRAAAGGSSFPCC